MADKMTGLLPYQTALVDSTKAADLYNIHQVLQHELSPKKRIQKGQDSVAQDLINPKNNTLVAQLFTRLTGRMPSPLLAQNKDDPMPLLIDLQTYLQNNSGPLIKRMTVEQKVIDYLNGLEGIKPANSSSFKLPGPVEEILWYAMLGAYGPLWNAGEDASKSQKSIDFKLSPSAAKNNNLVTYIMEAGKRWNPNNPGESDEVSKTLKRFLASPTLENIPNRAIDPGNIYKKGKGGTIPQSIVENVLKGIYSGTSMGKNKVSIPEKVDAPLLFEFKMYGKGQPSYPNASVEKATAVLPLETVALIVNATHTKKFPLREGNEDLYKIA